MRRFSAETSVQGWTTRGILGVAPIAQAFGAKVAGYKVGEEAGAKDPDGLGRSNGLQYLGPTYLNANVTRPHLAVHEVVLKEGPRQTAFKTGADAADAGMLASATVGAVKSLLQKIYAVKPEGVCKVAGLPAADLPKIIGSYDELKEKLNGTGSWSNGICDLNKTLHFNSEQERFLRYHL